MDLVINVKINHAFVEHRIIIKKYNEIYHLKLKYLGKRKIALLSPEFPTIRRFSKRNNMQELIATIPFLYISRDTLNGVIAVNGGDNIEKLLQYLPRFLLDKKISSVIFPSRGE